MRYIVGGANTIYTSLNNLESSKKINEIFVNTTDILETFGKFLKHKPENIKKSATKNIDRLRSYYMFQGCKIYVDSGGFQISTGKIKPSLVDRITHIYYEWLCENKSYDFAFTLDVPPSIVKYDIDEGMLNRKSYEIAVGLPDEIRKKMIYIHQFGSSASYHLFKNMLVDLDIVNKFDYFSLGGLVSGYREFPVHPVVFGIIPILRELKRIGKKKFNLHILGQSNSAIVILFALMTKKIKEYHSIDTTITYDSVTPINDTFEFRRFCCLNEDNKFCGVDLRNTINGIETYSKFLDRKLKVLEQFDIDTSKFYVWHEENSVKSKCILFLITLVDMYRYQQMIEEMVENGIEFEELVHYSKNKQKEIRKSTGIYHNSMRLLESLDLDKCDHYYRNYILCDSKSQKDKHLTF